MKLADSTIYNDSDLTIPTTPNSIISAEFRGGITQENIWLHPRLLVRDNTIEQPLAPYVWRYESGGSDFKIEDLSNIVIIYRAPADGSQGPELIQPLHDIRVEKALKEFDLFLERVVAKLSKVVRVLVEEE